MGMNTSSGTPNEANTRNNHLEICGRVLQKSNQALAIKLGTVSLFLEQISNLLIKSEFFNENSIHSNVPIEILLKKKGLFCKSNYSTAHE